MLSTSLFSKLLCLLALGPQNATIYPFPINYAMLSVVLWLQGYQFHHSTWFNKTLIGLCCLQAPAEENQQFNFS